MDRDPAGDQADPAAGQRAPVSARVSQGWVSRAALRRTPAPVVTMTATGRSAAILTLIVPTAPGVPVGAVVGAVVGPASGGWYRLRVLIGGRQLAFLVSADGDIVLG